MRFLAECKRVLKINGGNKLPADQHGKRSSIAHVVTPIIPQVPVHTATQPVTHLRPTLSSSHSTHSQSTPDLVILNSAYKDEMQNLEDLKVGIGDTVVPLRIVQTLIQLLRIDVIRFDNVFKQYDPNNQETNKRISEVKVEIMCGKSNIKVDEAINAYGFLVRTFAHFEIAFLSADIFGRMVKYNGEELDTF